ncbi:MAG: hypothetical protein PUP92_24705 [Rhizonema sp. PD38]|nr:hypothetical protein [Rhizonema sp. PD38]
MNLRTLLVGALIAVPLFSTSVRADENVPEGEVYRGGGYTVYVVGDYYKGCDAQKRCIEIDHIAKRTAVSSSWKNRGFTYTLSRLSQQHGKPRARLRAVDPQGKVLVNVVMTLDDYFN